MSNGEIDTMVEREQLIKALLPIAALLLFGWAIFNGAQKQPEFFETSTLSGCYGSKSGLSVEIRNDRLHLFPSVERSIGFAIEREKIGLTIVPEAVITIDPDSLDFRVTSLEESRWIPNITLRRFTSEARYTVIDTAKANGLTMLGYRDARAIDFYRQSSCRR